jgi:hypothetical protein
MTDRCREERTAALRRPIEDAEASGISACSVDEDFAEARALLDERRCRIDSAAEVRSDVRPRRGRTG